MKKCTHCNSPMTFDEEHLIYICDYCGREYSLDEVILDLSDYLKKEGDK